jgi:hypothetical protein
MNTAAGRSDHPPRESDEVQVASGVAQNIKRSSTSLHAAGMALNNSSS